MRDRERVSLSLYANVGGVSERGESWGHLPQVAQRHDINKQSPHDRDRRERLKRETENAIANAFSEELL